MLIINPIRREQLKEFMDNIKKIMAMYKVAELDKEDIIYLYTKKFFNSDNVTEFENVVMAEINPALSEKKKWNISAIYHFNKRLEEYCDVYRTTPIVIELSIDNVAHVLTRMVEAIRFRYNQSGKRGRTRKCIKRDVYELLDADDLYLLEQLTFNQAFTLLQQFGILSPYRIGYGYKLPPYRRIDKIKRIIRTGIELL